MKYLLLLSLLPPLAMAETFYYIDGQGEVYAIDGAGNSVPISSVSKTQAAGSAWSVDTLYASQHDSQEMYAIQIDTGQATIIADLRDLRQQYGVEPSPTDVALDGLGNLYFASDIPTLWRMDLATYAVTLVSGDANVQVGSGEPISGAQTMIVRTDGKILVSQGTQPILLVDPDTGERTVFHRPAASIRNIIGIVSSRIFGGNGIFIGGYAKVSSDN
jgi:hypothetical protein